MALCHKPSMIRLDFNPRNEDNPLFEGMSVSGEMRKSTANLNLLHRNIRSIVPQGTKEVELVSLSSSHVPKWIVSVTQEHLRTRNIVLFEKRLVKID